LKKWNNFPLDAFPAFRPKKFVEKFGEKIEKQEKSGEGSHGKEIKIEPPFLRMTGKRRIKLKLKTQPKLGKKALSKENLKYRGLAPKIFLILPFFSFSRYFYLKNFNNKTEKVFNISAGISLFLKFS